MQGRLWTHRQSNVKKCYLCLLCQVTILAPLRRMHPLDVRFVVLSAKRRLDKIDAFRTTALPSGLLKNFLSPEHLAESTHYSNDSSTVASRTLAWTDPKLSGVVVLERRFALPRNRMTQNWATKTSSDCVLNNESGVTGVSCLYGPALKFGATRKLISTSSCVFHQNAEFIEACR